jgi:hypothetical protein
MGITHPAWYGQIMSILISQFSLFVIPATYALTFAAAPKRVRQTAGLVTSFVVSVWYELIYFSPRALYESLSTSLLALGVWILLKPWNKHAQNFEYVSSSFFITLGALIRPHYALIVIVAGVFVWHTKKAWGVNRFLLGTLIAVLLGGTVDLLTTGTFLGSFLNYFTLQLQTGVSTTFGTQTPEYYLTMLAITSVGFIFLTIPSLTNRKSWWLWAIYAGLLITHTLSPHKEYRFIFIVLPIQIILITLGVTQLCLWLKTKAVYTYLSIGIPAVAVSISFLAFANRLPNIKAVYPHPLIWKDPILKTANALYNDKQVCGVFDESNAWPISLSYYTINRNIPLYSQDYPPPSDDVISHKIIETNVGLQVMVKQPPTCVIDAGHSNKRTFPEIESLLEESQFLSVE